MEDRRRIPRVPVFFIIEALTARAAAEDPPGPENQGVVKNITPDGLLLETNAKLDKHDLLQLTFTLPGTVRTLNVEAKVRWCEKKKVWTLAGLEFMDLAEEERDAIMDHLMGLGPEV